MADISVDLNTAAAGNIADVEPVEEEPVEAAEEAAHEEPIITSTAIENSKVEADVLDVSEPETVEKAASVSSDTEPETPVVTEEMIASLDKTDGGSSPVSNAVLDSVNETVMKKAPEIAATDASITASAYASIQAAALNMNSTGVSSDVKPSNANDSTVSLSNALTNAAKNPELFSSVNQGNPSEIPADGKPVSGENPTGIVSENPEQLASIPKDKQPEINQGGSLDSANTVEHPSPAPANKEDGSSAPSDLTGKTSPAISGNYSTEALRYSAMAGAAASSEKDSRIASDGDNVSGRNVSGKADTVNEPAADTDVSAKSAPKQSKFEQMVNKAEDFINRVTNNSGNTEPKTQTRQAHAEDTKAHEVKEPVKKEETGRKDPIERLKESRAEKEKIAEKQEEKKEKIKKEQDKEARNMNKILSDNKPNNTGKSVNKAGKTNGKGTKTQNVSVKLVKDENGRWKAERPETIEFLSRDIYMQDAKSEYLRSNPEPTFSEHFDAVADINEDVANTSKSIGSYSTGIASAKDGDRETYYSKYSKWKSGYNKHMKALEKDYQANNENYREQYFAYRRAQLKAEELNKRIK